MLTRELESEEFWVAARGWRLTELITPAGGRQSESRRMEVMWREKDVGTEGEFSEFFYCVTSWVIWGSSVWMWVVSGRLGEIRLVGDAPSGLFLV